jgi:SAM-dependent methyltransferase
MKKNSKDSVSRFGYEWNHYREMLDIHEIQFRNWMPFLAPSDWSGKTFLDVGCGMGRNSFWPMVYGASKGKAVDLDERSLKAARLNLARFPGMEVKMESAYELTDKKRFDVVFSIGVVHHLEHPGKALKKMRDAAKPGGLVCVWVYGYENNEWVVRWFDPFRRALFSRLPIGWVHALSALPASFLWLFLRTGKKGPAYLSFLRGLSFPHIRSIVFDQMLPQIARYYRREEVESLMTGAGLTNVRIEWVNEISWAACGTAPG